ncbi:c-type cytochrome [Achromobacter sp. NPDC058515]|uniref:c-type cytochrome n=1 Tax=Achromobacter sp. NPDC058515 TaxID=3346533 RepID=UPI003650DB2F
MPRAIHGGSPLRRIAHPTRLLLILVALLVTCACGDGRPPLSPPALAAGKRAEADPARGARLIAERGCIACHIVSGVRGPASNVGPPLHKLWRQAYVAGVLPNTTDNLVRWLLDPPAINPRTAMPATGLQTADAEDIAAFLLSRDDVSKRTP